MGAALNQHDLTTWRQICIAWIQSGSFGSVVLHVDLVIKPNAFTYWINAPVQCDVHPYVHSLSKKKETLRCLGHLTLTGSMKKSLSPWPAAINSISHSSLCVSHFSHSLDKFIYMKDHSYWQGGLQVNDNLTNDFMWYYHLPATYAAVQRLW